MKYRLTDYILPILAPLMVYVIILVGFVWQHNQNTDERVRYRMIEIVNVLIATQDHRQLIVGKENAQSNQQLKDKYRYLQNEKHLPKALNVNVFNFTESETNLPLTEKERIALSKNVLNLSSLSRPIFQSTSGYWHYITPLNSTNALLLSLDKADAQFAWYNDTNLIIRVIVLTFAVILLMLMAFRKYIRISVEQAKELQQHEVSVKTREIS